MKIGEMFIKLGIEGGKDAAKSLKNIQVNLQNLRKKTLILIGTMTAIAAVIKRMSTNSQNAGQSLRDFENNTGVSARTLQRWQHAGRKAGASAESMRQSFSSLGEALAGQRWGDPIEGFEIVNAFTELRKIDTTDTLGVMKELRKFAQMDLPQFTAVEITRWLRSFGLTDDVIAAMKRGELSESHMRGARLYDANKIKQLAKNRNKWADISDKWEKTIEVLTTKVTPALQKAADALITAINIMTKRLGGVNVGFLKKTIGSDLESLKRISRISPRLRGASGGTVNYYNVFTGGGSRVEAVAKNPNKVESLYSKELEHARRQNKSNNRGN